MGLCASIVVDRKMAVARGGNHIDEERRGLWDVFAQADTPSDSAS